MSTATLTSKGQLTLPKDVRDALGLKAGDKVEFQQVNGEFIVRPRNRDARDLAGILYRAGERALTVEEMDEALGKALGEDDERIRAGH